MLLGILLGFIFVPFEMHRLEYIHIAYIFKETSIARVPKVATTTGLEQDHLNRISATDRARLVLVTAAKLPIIRGLAINAG